MAKTTPTPPNPSGKTAPAAKVQDPAAAAALAAAAGVPGAAAKLVAAKPAPPLPAAKAAAATDAHKAEAADDRPDRPDDGDPQVAMVDGDATAYAELAGGGEVAQEATQDAGASTPAEGDDEGGISSTALIVGGVLLGGAGIALAAGGGGGGGSTPTPTPTPTPPPTNAAPTVTAATQSVTTNEDTAATITVSASDANGDALTYTAATPTNGTVSGGNNGAFTYTPRANFAGTDSFVVTVSDGKGGTVTQTVNITVAAVNDAPTFAAATRALTTAEDSPVSFAPGATDVEGDTLTYTVSGATGGTAAVGTDGQVTFTPTANFNGAASFTLTASDGKGGSVSQTVNVTVTPVNDAPTVAATQTVATNEDTAVTVALGATDADGDTLSYAVSGATNGTVAAGTTPGSFVFTPAANFNGTGSFAVTVTDGKGGSTTQTVTVNVAAVNDAPTIDSTATRSITTAEDTQAAFVIDASDVDTPDSQLTARIATAPANGTIVSDAQGNSFYRPNANFTGTDSFVVAVSDGQATTSYTVNVTVTPVNDAPVFAAATRTVATSEDQAVTFAPAATDVDGDPLTYAVGPVANGTATVGSDGRVTFTPAANFSGQTSFVLTASDGKGGTASQTVTVTVASANDAPSFAAASRSVAGTEDQPVSFTATATDPEGDTLTYSAAGATNGVVVATGNGGFTYTPNANFNGTETITVTANDGNGGTATQTVTITVAPVNDAPAFAAATRGLTTAEDQPLTFAPGATDVDGDALTYSVGQVTNGTASVGADGRVTFTPTQDFNGAASFVLTVSDGKGGTASQTVNVTVGAANDAPTFASPTQAITAVEDGSVTFTPAATDPDGDSLTYTVGPVANGTATVAANGAITFTPAANFNGQTSFVVTANDGKGGTATQTVNATVTPVNDAPTFAAATQAVSTNEDTAVTVTAAATDIDGDALTYTAGGATNGTVAAGATPGSFVFTPAANFNGAASFVLTASDGQGGTATQTVNVTVVNQPDIVNLDTLDQPGNGGDGDVSTTRIFDAGTTDFRFDDSSGQPSNTRLNNFGQDDVIQVDDVIENYNFSSNGTDIFISYQTAAGVVNLFELGGVVANPNVLVFDEASAEQAAGFDFFRTTAAAQGATTVSLDVDPDNNLNTVANFSGAGFATTFTENANTPDFVRISNFGTDDRILVNNAATGDFNFSSNGTDIFISYQTPGGSSNDITLAGVVRDGSVLVFDEATAEQAAGFDFFQIGSGTTPTPTPPAQTSSLDTDTDNNLNTQAVFNAGGIAGTFTENANAPDYVRLDNFRSDDRILVSNARAGDFNFSSNGTDIFITYQTPDGTVNDITITGVVQDGNVLVFDEASAEQAAGFDFFQFA